MAGDDETEVKKKHTAVKSNFIGSPVRVLEEGGLLPQRKSKCKTVQGGEDEEEVADLPRAKGGISGDAKNTKGAIDFYGLIND